MKENKFLEKQYERLNNIYGTLEEGIEGTFLTPEELEDELKHISNDIKEAFGNNIISNEELSTLEKEIEKCRDVLQNQNAEDENISSPQSEEADKVKKILKKYIWLEDGKRASFWTLILLFILALALSQCIFDFSISNLVLTLFLSVLTLIIGGGFWIKLFTLLKSVNNNNFTYKQVKVISSKKKVYKVVDHDTSQHDATAYLNTKYTAKAYAVQDLTGKKLGYYFSYGYKNRIPINSDKINVYLVKMRIDDKTERFLVK